MWAGGVPIFDSPLDFVLSVGKQLAVLLVKVSPKSFWPCTDGCENHIGAKNVTNLATPRIDLKRPATLLPKCKGSVSAFSVYDFPRL